ncbi:hypothetical protein BGZ58_004099 [Dissophora ornata]|nr:hypothetical protein BGZ58_004099 [Dissophora ornata]
MNSPLEKVFTLPELQGHIVHYLDRGSLVLCTRVSAQWHRLFNPHLWRKVLFRVPRDFSRQGYLVQTLDLHMGDIPQDQRNHIRQHCSCLRTVHLHFQQLAPQGLKHLFDPIQHNGFVGEHIVELEIHVAEFSVIPLILPWLTHVRRKGYLVSLQRFMLGNGQLLGESQQIEVEDVLRFLQVFPKTRMLSFGRIPIGESRQISAQEAEWEKWGWRENDEDVEQEDYADKEQPDQRAQEQEQEQTVESGSVEAPLTSPLYDLDIYPRTISVLSRLLRRAPGLNRLCIRKAKDPQILSVIQESCPRLTNFRYVGNGRKDLIEFDRQTFLPHYPFTDALFFEDALITDRTVHAIAESCFRTLQHLTLSYGTMVTTNSLIEILRSCTALEWLQCTTDSVSGDLFSHANSWTCCGSLRVLKLFGVQLQGLEENEAFRVRIRQLPRLEMLSVKGSGFRIESLLNEEDLSISPSSSFSPSNGSSGVSFEWSPSETTAVVFGARHCYRHLGVITMPKFERGVITLPHLKALLEAMPHVAYINFLDGYDEEAREWLRVHRPNLDMGVVVW